MNIVPKTFPIESMVCYNLPQFSKIRLGKRFDGGYVIIDGLNYDYFISCGIAGDDSFEQDFLSRHENLTCEAFDGRVKRFPNPHARVKFHSLHIGDKDTEKTTNLHDLIGEKENIFLKMDIEKGEYPWIHSLSDEQLGKFKQIVIEFHRPFENSRWECLEKLARTHYLVHIHGNNYQTCSLFEFEKGEEIIIGSSKKPVKTIQLCKKYPKDTKLVIKKHRHSDQFTYCFKGDILEIRRTDLNSGWGHCHVGITNSQYIPKVFECTYVRKTEFVDMIELNKNPVPARMDMPNHSKIMDISLTGYPYTKH